MSQTQTSQKLNLQAIAEDFKTPLFVYDHGQICEKVRALKAHLSNDLQIYYAAKANPNKELLRSLRDVVDGLDISSVGEIRQALSVGYDAGPMSFAGPGKGDQELEYSIVNGAGLSVESLNELARIEVIAERLNKRASISVRVNPKKLQKKFAIKMGGRSTQFGIDEDSLAGFVAAVSKTKQCDLKGLHVYAGTQCLHSESLILSQETTLEIARRMILEYGVKLEKINFGGGFGIPYYEDQKTLDSEPVCKALTEKFRAFKAEVKLPDLIGILEFGRYLVGEAGYYITRVVDVKESQGKIFAVLDGGMNHHLAASGNLGQIVRKNYRIQNLSRPETGENVTVDFVGPLCTSIDLMGDHVETVKPEIGDFICFLNSGAYAYTASPLLFLSHKTPREVLVQNGAAKLIRESFGCEAFD